MIELGCLKRIAEIEFADIVTNSVYIDFKLRIIFINHSFLDVHLSQRLSDKFVFHWQCLDQRGTF